jgi:integrase
MGLSLWKRNGVWYARGRVALPDGTSVPVNRSTRIEVAPGTRRIAERAAQRLADEARGGAHARPGAAWHEPTSTGATVRDAVEAYLRRRDVCGDFVRLLESFASAFGGVRLVDLDEAAILAWARSGPRLRARGVDAAPRTVQGRLKAVRVVLRMAERKLGWAVPELELPASGRGAKLAKWLSIEDRDRLLAAFDPHWRPFATTLFMTGARPVELGRLTWGDVRAPTRHQAFGRLILRHLKGRSHGALEWRSRDVPIGRELVECLGAPGRPDEVVFRDTAGKPVSDGTARQELAAAARVEIGEAFRLAAESAGLAHLGITPYWARHTFASLLVQDGVPLQVVAELLGHTSTQEVESTYGHLAPHQKEDAVRSLGRMA